MMIMIMAFGAARVSPSRLFFYPTRLSQSFPLREARKLSAPRRGLGLPDPQEVDISPSYASWVLKLMGVASRCQRMILVVLVVARSYSFLLGEGA